MGGICESSLMHTTVNLFCISELYSYIYRLFSIFAASQLKISRLNFVIVQE